VVQGASHPVPEEGLTYEEQLSIVIVGTIAGLLTAYQGFSKAGKPFVLKLFLDRVITAIIASLGIAIASVVVEEPVTLFTLILVFLASVGAATFALKGRLKTPTG
ncbi:hypothetical protein LCGC14_2755570, partial [marine sediment metagenome]